LPIDETQRCTLVLPRTCLIVSGSKRTTSLKVLPNVIARMIWSGVHDSMESAITREKALKAWNRLWEIQLIENNNPYWRDLYSEICD
jgi:predicted GIY-YIG superfamily endonuclease